MKSKFLKISNVEVLSRVNLKTIQGSAVVDLSLCGCDCAGAVTGPAYCSIYFACLQVYTCQDEM